MRKFSKEICAVFLLLSLSMLGGCIPHTELNEKAIVLAIGIDYEGSEDEYSVSFQYYNPTGIGGRTLVDNSQPNVMTSSGKGKSVYAALDEASFKCGRELMLGVTQILVLGRSAVENSVERVIEFSKTYFQSHPDLMIVVAEEKAEDYMEVKFSEGIVSTQKLQFMMKNAEKNGYMSFPAALDLFTAMNTESKSICLPKMKLIEDGKSDASKDGKTIEIDGGVLIKDGAMAGETGLDAMSGLQLIKGKGQTLVLTFDSGDASVSLEAFNIKTKISPRMEDGRAIFNVELSCEGRYLETPSADFSDSEAQSLAAREIMKKLKAAVSETVTAFGADTAELEKITRHGNYQMWKEIESGWEDHLKNARFDLSVRVDVDGLSLT